MVEVKRHPELKGKPVIVGGVGKRGVVATASYEARVHGVMAAVPTVIARRRCPEGAFLPCDHKEYAETSKRIMSIFYSYTPRIEAISLDEAFLDISGAIHLMGSPLEIAQKIREEVFLKEGLWCSIGISTQKHVAKIASKKAKPQIRDGRIHEGAGIVEVSDGGEVDFLKPLSIKEIWGIGRVTYEKFSSGGIECIGQIIDMDFEELKKILGDNGAKKLKGLLGGDESIASIETIAAIETIDNARTPKSISAEETFAEDILSKEELNHHIVRLSDKVAGRLRKANFKTKRVSLKFRYSEGFKTVTRDSTLPLLVDSGVFIARKAKELLAQEKLEGGIRLIGIRVSQFADTNNIVQGELGLFEKGDSMEVEHINQWERIEETIDKIRRKFEQDSIQLGSSLYSTETDIAGKLHNSIQ